MEIKELIEDFSNTRPKAEIIVGYGSGVKKQANDSGLTKQIDLIYGVENPDLWHEENFRTNPNDYSEYGFKLLSHYKNFGTKINYLTFLKHENSLFKIGICSTRDLLKDLTEWESFYMAGRFQKPIEIIKSSKELESAIEINRLNALKTALLISEELTITEHELYKNICSLSFIGDWRRIFHLENPNKIDNIVTGSFEELHNMYDPLNDYCFGNEDMMIIDQQKLMTELDSLPYELLKKISNKINLKEMKYNDYYEMRTTVLRYLKEKNLKASAAQPLKGLLLNGVSKTKTYLKQKIDKSKF